MGVNQVALTTMLVLLSVVARFETLYPTFGRLR
jgi:hypothetical protein